VVLPAVLHKPSLVAVCRNALPVPPPEAEMLMRIPSAAALRRRLLPLHVAVALQGFMLWVPVEKLFMNEIGFDAAAVGVMAAAYAAVVPLVEIPSGILADRWSRRGVLAMASAALALTALVGGLSDDVPTYIASALLLGVYFAMYSGTLDAIVYDTVLEETGAGHGFDRRIGRVRAIESAALVASALAGGWLAELTTTRTTYFLTVPFAALSIVALLRFREPQLHKTEQRLPQGVGKVN
jgi:MFS family permease